MEKTQRGFDVLEFQDRNYTECTLQKSSLATEDCIWLGADKIGLKEFVANRIPLSWTEFPEVDEHSMEHHYSANTRMHLTREQVKELLPFLIKFVETGELS